MLAQVLNAPKKSQKSFTTNNDKAKQIQINSDTFSYLDNKNNPPDLILRNTKGIPVYLYISPIILPSFISSV